MYVYIYIYIIVSIATIAITAIRPKAASAGRTFAPSSDLALEGKGVRATDECDCATRLGLASGFGRPRGDYELYTEDIHDEEK